MNSADVLKYVSCYDRFISWTWRNSTKYNESNTLMGIRIYLACMEKLFRKNRSTYDHKHHRNLKTYCSIEILRWPWGVIPTFQVLTQTIQVLTKTFQVLTIDSDLSSFNSHLPSFWLRPSKFLTQTFQVFKGIPARKNIFWYVEILYRSRDSWILRFQ